QRCVDGMDVSFVPPQVGVQVAPRVQPGVGVVNAIERERRAHADDLAEERRKRRKVKIGAASQRLFRRGHHALKQSATETLRRSARMRPAASRPRGAISQISGDDFAWARALGQQSALRIDLSEAMKDNLSLRMPLRQQYSFCQLLRQPHVIGIEKANQL